MKKTIGGVMMKIIIDVVVIEIVMEVNLDETMTLAVLTTSTIIRISLIEVLKYQEHNKHDLYFYRR